MEVFFNQLSGVLIVFVAVLVACAAYRIAYSKMTLLDSPESSAMTDEGKKKIEPYIVISCRDKSIGGKEKGEDEDAENSENGENADISENDG